MTADIAASVTLNPKIKDAQSAQRELTNFVRNPPSSPIEAVKTFGNMLGVGTAISAGITAVFPLAGPVLPILSGIFDLFGSSGPSIGELTLDAISNLSSQLSEGLKNLQDATQEAVDAAANKTIDVIAQGIDQAAREASAADVLEAVNLQAVLQQEAEAKATAYADFLNQMQAARKDALGNLQSMVDDAQKQVNDKYAQLQAQVYAMVAEIAPILLGAFNNYLNTDTPPSSSDSQSRALQLSAPSPAPASQNSDNTLLIAGGIGVAVIAVYALSKKKN